MSSQRVAMIVRQRRKRRRKRGGSAEKMTRWIGISVLLVLFLIVTLVIGSVSGGILIYASYASELPPPEEILDFQSEAFRTTVFYDRTGNVVIHEVIDPLGGDRQDVTLDEVPDYFINATIAIEDASFYDNPGFDIWGIARAMWTNLSGGELQGGSTITQQVVKNTLGRNELSVDRKLREIILAAEISRVYSKEQILEAYINSNFYGNLAYGIEAASRVYFGKAARDLTLSEATMLAAIPQFPAQNPIDNMPTARQRQRIVLDTMVEEGYLTAEEADAAYAEEIALADASERFTNFTAPHFAQYAQREAEAILNSMGLNGSQMISREGVRVYTTLDVDLQQQLECTARSHVTRLSTGNGAIVENTYTGQPCVAAFYLPDLSSEMAELASQQTVTNAAGLVLNAQTGEIIAMLGSLNYADPSIDGEFNATLAQRQPASTFKPFVYLTAFFNPINQNTVVTPATMTYDIRREFENFGGEPYTPENIDFQYHGPVSVREALARSYNVPVVQVLNWVGLSKVLRTAHSMGINSMNEGISAYGLSLALGTAEASLLDMTYAYNVLNNLGYMVGTPVSPNQARVGYRQLNPNAILRIESAEGEILWQYGQESGTFDRRPILEPAMAYMVTDILADNEARISSYFPEGNALELNRPAAAKTGTSDEFRDSWTIGYTPQYTTGIWVGNHDNAPMQEVTGLVGAGAIWHAVMEYVHNRDDLPIEIWDKPDTIVEERVCMTSGLRPTRYCPQKEEIFYYDSTLGIDYRPNQVDSYWQEINVNACNNTLATVYSPADCVEPRVYFVYPPELEDWAEDTPGLELPPTESDIAGTESPFRPVRITEPSFLDRVSGEIEIRGNAQDDELDYFYLEMGVGDNPENWQRLTENSPENGRNILLGSWDTRSLPDGLYTLRLSVVRTDATSEISIQQVTVDNTPPTVRLSEPTGGITYSAEQDVFLELVAEPADNYQVNYVEFYAGDQKIGEVTQGPYRFRWPIEQEGEVTLQAVVVDDAGNTAQSEPVTVQLVP